MQHLLAVFGVGDLGMELHAVEPAALVTHRGGGTFVGDGDGGEALRRMGDVVVVAHPANTFGGNIGKEDVVARVDLDLAVLTAVLSTLDHAACHVCHQLTAVADAEDRNTCVKNCRIKVGRVGIGYAVGTSRKDDAAVVLGFDLIDRDFIVRLDLGIDVLLTNTTRDQLVILTAEIKYEYLLHLITALLHFTNYDKIDLRFCQVQ